MVAMYAIHFESVPNVLRGRTARLRVTSLRRQQSFTSQSNPDEYNPPPGAVTLHSDLPVADDMATFQAESLEAAGTV